MSVYDILVGPRPAGVADRPAVPATTGPRLVVGVVRSVSEAGVRFTIPDLDRGRFLFGPAEWDRVKGQPEPGATCIAAFLDPTSESDDVWIILWEGPEHNAAAIATIGDAIDALDARIDSLEAAPPGSAPGFDEAIYWTGAL